MDLTLQVGRDGEYVDDDIDSVTYFNGRRLSHGYSENLASGLYDAPLLQHPSAAGAWAKPRHYYVPSWLADAGDRNQIAVWVAATDGPSGVYEGPLVLSGGDKTMDLGGEWKARIPGDIGPSVEVTKIRLRCTRATDVPVVRRLAVYRSAK